jgi:hypothetical protein
VHTDVVPVNLDDAVDDNLSSSEDLRSLVILACNEDVAMYCLWQ